MSSGGGAGNAARSSSSNSINGGWWGGSLPANAANYLFFFFLEESENRAEEGKIHQLQQQQQHHNNIKDSLNIMTIVVFLVTIFLVYVFLHWCWSTAKQIFTYIQSFANLCFQFIVFAVMWLTVMFLYNNFDKFFSSSSYENLIDFAFETLRNCSSTAAFGTSMSPPSFASDFMSSKEGGEEQQQQHQGADGAQGASPLPYCPLPLLLMLSTFRRLSSVVVSIFFSPARLRDIFYETFISTISWWGKGGGGGGG